jgi:hypothetical protein
MLSVCSSYARLLFENLPYWLPELVKHFSGEFIIFGYFLTISAFSAHKRFYERFGAIG